MPKDKPHNNGQWTEARFKSFIISALRSATTRWGPKQQCIKNARVSRGLYKCECCGAIGPPTLPPPEGKTRRIKNIVADHVEPVVDVQKGFVDWDEYVKRMFVELEGFQALCHKCHTDVKSKREKELRLEYGTLRQTNEREYNSWKSMVNRCNNPNNDAYHNYGGRGIKVCKRWLDFKNFLEDMAPRPDGMSLDRINVNGDYSKNNCKWSNPYEQANNRRDNILLEYKGEVLTLAEWSRKLDMPTNTIRNRLERGDTVEKVLSLNRVRGKRPSEILKIIDKIIKDYESGDYTYEDLSLKYGYNKDYIRKEIAKQRKLNDKS